MFIRMIGIRFQPLARMVPLERSSPSQPAVFHASTSHVAMMNRIGLTLTVPATKDPMAAIAARWSRGIYVPAGFWKFGIA
mgnify:CR=1 FL=1